MRKSDGVRVHHKEELWGKSSPLEKEGWVESSPQEKGRCGES